jgi:riboflavin kinase/FMN adenylyltransferase
VQTFSEGAYPADGTRAAVTVGVYDGVHLGHRHVLDRLRTRAATEGLTTVVVTFDPHPAVVLSPERAPLLLTTLARRVELLADEGIDRCVVVGFDSVRATQDPTAFVDRVLVQQLRAAAVVVGENFRFGQGRTGDVALLRTIAAREGFEVEGVALDASGGLPISSTRIRELLAGGEVHDAGALLGRPHELEGIVEKGDGRGRSLGYPTANLAVTSGLCVPAVGIYAGVWTRPSGERAPAAISVGRRPTFYEHGDVLVEAYLLDVDDSLYGEVSRVAFHERLRGEEKFDSVDDLVVQIGRDVDATRRLVGQART